MQALEAIHFLLWDLLQLGQTGTVKTEGAIDFSWHDYFAGGVGAFNELGLESNGTRVGTMCATAVNATQKLR